MEKKDFVKTKPNYKEAIEVSAGVFGGLVTSAIISKALSDPRLSAGANVLAGAAIAGFGKPAYLKAFGATHVAVGAADGIRVIAGDVKNLPKLSGMNGRRRKRKYKLNGASAPLLQGGSYENMLLQGAGSSLV